MLQFWSAPCFSKLNSSFVCLARGLHKWYYVSLSALYQEDHNVSLLLILIFTPWLRYYLPTFSTIKLLRFFLWFVAKYFEIMQIFCSSLNFYLIGLVSIEGNEHFNPRRKLKTKWRNIFNIHEKVTIHNTQNILSNQLIATLQ